MFQKAKCVVLSANGTETPRLLLLSKSNRFQQGLANSSGMVGKYLMSGNGGGASGLFDRSARTNTRARSPARRSCPMCPMT